MKRLARIYKKEYSEKKMNLKLTKSSKPLTLSIISISLLFSLTVWLSANAITPQLIELWCLAIQTAFGFALTNISIWLLPVFFDIFGWNFGFMFY